MNGALKHPKWASLARDLAVMTMPDSPIADVKQICTQYDMSEEELASLISNGDSQPYLQHELSVCQSRGAKASQIYRFGSLGQALGEKLWNDAMNDGLKAAEAIKLLELFMKAGSMLDMPKDTPTVNVQTNVGVGVSLPLPVGLSNPKLRHLEAR